MVNRQSSIAAPGLPNANGNQKLPKCLEGMNVNIVRAVQNAPKHVSISYSACDHELLYETIVLFSATIAFFAQILHIYRTVWWLPQSYQSQAVVCQVRAMFEFPPNFRPLAEILPHQSLSGVLCFVRNCSTLVVGNCKVSCC